MKILLVSLGCNKNLVDSEMILGALVKNGHEITLDEKEADYIIVNTCAFINDAKEESINKIIELSEARTKKCKGLIVTGCLAQRYEKEIKEELPEVDCIAGINDYETILKFINKRKKINPEIEFHERVRSTAPHTAYVKIADGCNNRCSYCAIPAIRGNHVSRTMEDIVKEVNAIVAEGVQEIVLIAQDTSFYGRDIYGKPMLSELLKKLEKVDGLHWIRILYTYPEGITKDLIKVIKKSKKVCRYFDIPIQHINDEVLKNMNRHTNKKAIEKLLKTLRKKMPDVSLRTSLIVGFPGETAEQFEELKEFVKKAKFDKLGVFEYSKEEGTAAAKMKGQIPTKVKKERKNQIMEVQQQVSLKNNKKVIGKKLEVLVEGMLEDGTYFGRTYKDAPEIDGYTFIETKKDLPLGEYTKVKIKKAQEYDLIGKL